MSRRILIFSTSDDREVVVTKDYRTWGDLVAGENLASLVSNKKCMVRETGETLDNKTVLPGNDCSIFLHTTKVKAGSERDLALSYVNHLLEQIRTIQK